MVGILNLVTVKNTETLGYYFQGMDIYVWTVRMFYN